MFIKKNITSSFLDEIDTVALKSGALGGKLLGSGWRVFVFIVPDNKKQKVRNALKKVLEINIRIGQI